jgi:peroxiredoxin
MALERCNAIRAGTAARPYFDHPEDKPEYAASTAFLANRLDPDYVRWVRTADPIALSARREELLERIIGEFGDIPFAPKWAKVKSDGRTLADYAKPRLEAMRSLAVGKVAPEIEGQDIDGKPMKLSDYRGKVVVLSFWRSWCGPCMRFVPDEKKLVERLRDRPFALLGINSDSDREKLKATIKKEGIAWPSWWDGGRTGGPIAMRWDVHAWPTLIVLDHTGVIRFKNLPHHIPRLLDEAVDSLLNEMRP